MTFPKGYNPPSSEDNIAHNKASEKVVCRNCNKSNPSNSRFCNQCGSKLNLECPKCGNTNNLPNSAFCNQCGTKINTNTIDSRLTTPIAERFKDFNNIDRNLILYSLSNYNIKIKYPSNWELFNKEEFEKNIGIASSNENESQIIVALRSEPEYPNDTFLESMAIQVLKPTIVISVESFLKRNLNDLKVNNNDFRLLEQTQTTLAGLNAYRAVYYSDGKTNLLISTQFENLIYSIYFVSEPSKYNQYLLDVEQMINSFEFIRPPKRTASITVDKQYNQKDGFYECSLHQYKIKISYPSSWTDYSNLNENIVIGFSPLKENTSEPTVTLNVFIKDYENPVEQLKDIVEANIQDLRNNYSDFLLHEYYPTTLGGFPSYLVLYSYEGDKYLTIFTIRFNKQYVLLYLSTPESYSKHLKDVEQMINSFEFL